MWKTSVTNTASVFEVTLGFARAVAAFLDLVLLVGCS